jgi:protein TonB
MQTSLKLLLSGALAVLVILPPVAAQDTRTRAANDLLKAVWPHYDLTEPSLKPWHLKARYKLYDDKGKHAEDGVFESWWASPKESRRTWSRGGSSHTDWHLPDGTLAYQEAGEPPELFEEKLERALIAPIPGHEEIDPAKFKSVMELMTATSRCVSIEKFTSDYGIGSRPAQGPFPTYCFEADRPVLTSSYSFGRVNTAYGEVVEFQGKRVARRVTMSEGDRPILEGSVEVLETIDAPNAALTPPQDAPRTEIEFTGTLPRSQADLDKAIANGFLIRKITPKYPSQAKKERIHGNVELSATIGADGRIHGLQVVSAPCASLAASAFRAVSQWGYRPYILAGKPIPVTTTVEVFFALKD